MRVAAVVTMLREIADRYEEVSEAWRSEPSAPQSADLAELDVLLLELDEYATEEVDQLRRRIELLMDRLGMVVAPVTFPGDDEPVEDI